MRNVPAHNAVCVPKLQGHFRESSEKNLYSSAQQMDEELRTQFLWALSIPLMPRADPSKSVSRALGYSGSEFQHGIAGEWREAAAVKVLSWCL